MLQTGRLKKVNELKFISLLTASSLETQTFNDVNKVDRTLKCLNFIRNIESYQGLSELHS